MSSKITKIVQLNAQKNHPVILENFETYLEHRQHDMKCLVAQDRSLSAVSEGVGNVVLVTGEKEMYYGHVKVQPSESEQTDLLHTFVARRNRETGKMRLYEVRTSTLKHVCHDRPSRDQPDAEKETAQLQSLRRKLDPRAVSRQRQQQYNRVDLSVMEDKLQSMLTETVVKDAAESCSTTITVVNNDLQQELCAKSNQNATTLANLYDAQKVIGADEWRILTQPAQTLLKISVENLQMANSYLENKVKAVMQSSDASSEQNLAIVRTCIYMDVLAKLAGRKAYLLLKEESLSPFAKGLNDPIRKAFLQHVQRFSKKTYQATKYTRTKTLLYYLALVFALEGRDVVPLRLIHQSLEIPRKELINYATMVGARYYSTQDYFVIGNVQPKSEESHVNVALDMLKSSLKSGKRSHRN
uniref:DNA-directed RNA polymerase I subunit RPA49 n=1 Tax=Anopheles minimus TaxID=112268 RepID=A0A182VTZ1_9DIPT